MSKKLISLMLVIAMVLSVCTVVAAESVLPADGVYTGTGIGMHSNIEVEVTIEGGKITAVKILSSDETPGISEPAIEQMPQRIIDAQSVDVDAVTNATMTSNGIKEAVTNALAGTTAAEDTEVSIKPDIIVVGAGMSGMVTAIYSAELGLNVLMLEGSVRMGGCIHYAGGTISGAGFKIQKENGVEDTPEQFYADIVAFGGEGEFNPDLARTHTERAKDAIDWLDENIKVDFADRSLVEGAYTALPTLRVTRALGMYNVGGALGYLYPLQERLEKHIADGKVQILYNTTVTELLVDGDECYGVKAGDVEYLAPSVALCTGGYSYCLELLQMAGFENVVSSAPSTSNGSGFFLAKAVGGVFDNMDEYVNFYGGGIPSGGFDMVYMINNTYPGLVYVNTDGMRVGAEEAGKTDMWRDAKENKLYAIISSNMIDKSAMLIRRPTGNKTPLTDNGWGDLEQLVEQGVCAYKADSIEELATKIGAENLTATIEAYNKDVAAGTDTAFGRKAENLLPVNEGPYYAILTLPRVWSGSSGGVRANGEGYLLREDGSVVKGLSLAGEILGPSNILGKINFGGINHAMCATWGMIAAEKAAERAGK